MDVQQISGRCWPQGYDVAFTIRDDDICYFTKPWMLEAVYKEAWKQGFRVSLAVIPYVKATFQGQIPKRFRGNNRIFPIDKNRQLVTYLKEKLEEGCIDIVQHGCTHGRERGFREFAVDDFALLSKKLKKGRELLSKTFDTSINVFVAPHEKISRAAWRVLNENEMNLCRRFTATRLFLIAFPSGMELGKFAKLLFRSYNPFKSMPSDVIDVSKILVIQWRAFLEGPNIGREIEGAKKAFARHPNDREVFVVAHHYWEYFDEINQEHLLKDRLAEFNEFLKFVKFEQGIWKTTLSEICSWIKRKDYRGTISTIAQTDGKN